MCLLAAMFVTFFNSLMTIFGRNCVLYFDLTGSYLFWSRSRNLILICHFSNDGEVELEPVRPPPPSLHLNPGVALVDPEHLFS